MTNWNTDIWILEIGKLRGTWVAQLVKHRSDFGLGHDLVVPEFKPQLGSGLTAQSLKPVSDSLCLSSFLFSFLSLLSVLFM